jgi:hypothetical protein
LCDGETVTKSVKYPQNSSMSLEYKWYRNGFVTSNISDSQLLDSSGDYKVILTSDIGCSAKDSLNVSVKDRIESIGVATSGPVCKGGTVLLKLNINKGSPGFRVTWNTSGVGNFSSSSDNTISNFKDSIIYKSSDQDLSTINFGVKVSGSCNTVEESLNQSLNESPEASILSYSPVNVYINQPIEFIHNSLFDKELKWNFGDSSPELIESRSSVSHTYTEGLPSLVKLIAYNANGCTDTTSILVNVINNQNLFIPNVFSPYSSDSENNKVKVYGANISESGFSFMIFNRWGQVVYQASDFTQANKVGWNGKLDNTGVDMSLGTYTYTLKGKYADGKEFEKVGTISLVK